MSHFSQALTEALITHDWTGAHLAGLCKTQPSTVSRYTSGRVAPKPSALVALLRHFTPFERGRIARAFVVDVLTQAGLAEEIDVTLRDEPSIVMDSPANGPVPPKGLSSELLGQVYRVAELARDVPEIAAIFAEFDRLIQRRAITAR